MIPLVRLSFAIDAVGAETAERALENADPAPVTVARFEDAGAWRLEALYLEAPERNRIASLLAEALGRTPDFDLAPLPERDWVRESLTGLAPVRAGRFIVHGAHDRGVAPPGAIALEIDAGAAFGTGHHATTLGCLEALGTIARAGRPQRVLDIGTGTGVLAIAAAKLWKLPVVAGDIDPAAVRVANANAGANGVRPLVRAHIATGVRHRQIQCGGRYDVVFANILAGPLMRLAGPVAGISSQRSKIILSGLLDEQTELVLAPWRAHGFTLWRRHSIDGWTTLVVTRR